MLAFLSPIVGSIRDRLYDAGGPGIYIALGIGFLLVVGTGIVILIVIAVKLLNHFRNKNR